MRAGQGESVSELVICPKRVHKKQATANDNDSDQLITAILDL
jgi:hypothetical protein